MLRVASLLLALGAVGCASEDVDAVRNWPALCTIEGGAEFDCALGFDRPNGWGVFLYVTDRIGVGGSFDPRDVDIQPPESAPSIAFHAMDDASWIDSIRVGRSEARGAVGGIFIRDFEYTPLPARSGTAFAIEASGAAYDAIDFTTGVIRGGPRHLTVTGVIDGLLCPASVEMCDALHVPRGRVYSGP